MKKILSITLFLISLGVFVACDKQDENKKEENKETQSEENKQSEEENTEETEEKDTKKNQKKKVEAEEEESEETTKKDEKKETQMPKHNFLGKIDKFKIRMQLNAPRDKDGNLTEGDVDGYYYYETTKIPIKFTGMITRTAKGTLIIDLTTAGKDPEFFSGVSNASESFAGEWKKGTKVLKFNILGQ
ncbi:MAG: hypothetical protein EAZ55_13235 [Cytophagales bacterium]|nr:MAG: hypothetical protein EAZ55_13235 [Cytophagales bacterium]